MTQTLSVAIATYNDAEFLPSCLDSISTLADEVVVYDANSSDSTQEILKKYKKLKTIVGPNHAIFHINKQKAIAACTMSWILQLDADEVVSKDLAKEIKDAISDKKSKHNGYWLNRSNYFLGRFLKKGGQYPDPTLRLYKNGYGHLPCLDVHEQAIVTGTTGHLKSDLLHFADKSFSRYIVRNNRYTDLLSTQITNPNFFDYFFVKPSIWFFKTYLRHRGYLDGFSGFVFSYFSALRFPISYVKYYEKKLQHSS